MKQVKEMVEIAGRELAKPRAFPVPLKEFLRIVVGGSIPSARTETDRMRFYRQFLVAWQVDEGAAKAEQGTLPILKLHPKDRPQYLIEHHSRKGFDAWGFALEAELFLTWQSGMLARRGASAARQRWGKKKGKKTLGPNVPALKVNLAALAAHLASKRVSPGIY